ncbi:unknown [Prevotella sp. CAG:279]|nr:unknown [Prevotella sp. CAG:279]
METISINLTVPTGWQELEDKQLRYVYSRASRNLPPLNFY